MTLNYRAVRVVGALILINVGMFIPTLRDSRACDVTDAVVGQGRKVLSCPKVSEPVSLSTPYRDMRKEVRFIPPSKRPIVYYHW